MKMFFSHERQKPCMSPGRYLSFLFVQQQFNFTSLCPDHNLPGATT